MNLENGQIREELQDGEAHGEIDEEYVATRLADVEHEGSCQEKEALVIFGMLEGSDTRIAPLRRALAVWGLTPDDLGVLSIHVTSTGANERNETHIWNNIFTQISRTPNNAIPIVTQKSLVGHSKGGSAAWQMTSLLQSINAGIVPGNRNNDNVDAEFHKHTYLMFPSELIHTDGIRAGVMSSFGFGQVGGTALFNGRNTQRAFSFFVTCASRTSTGVSGLVTTRSSYPSVLERPSTVLRLPLPLRTWRLTATWLVTRARHSRPRGTRGCRYRWILASSSDGRYVHIPQAREIHTLTELDRKAIFPQSIDGDLLNLVHLSNGFHMLDDASPLHIGDIVKTKAKSTTLVVHPRRLLVALGP